MNTQQITLVSVLDMEMPGEAKLVQFVAHRGGRFVGSATLAHPDRIVPEIQRLFTEPELRREGIASTLLDHCEQRCRALGKKSVALYTSKENGVAIAFYIARGYVLSFQFEDGSIVLSRQLSREGSA